MIVCEMRAMVRAAKGRLSISFRSGHADCVRWPRVRVATRDYEKNIIGGDYENPHGRRQFSPSAERLITIYFPPDINSVILYVIIVMILKKNKLKPHIIYAKPHNRQ